MIEWLLDLFLTNFWVIIILFWIVRAFFKGAKEGMQSTVPRKGRTVSNQNERMWEIDPYLQVTGESADHGFPESKHVVAKQEKNSLEKEGRSDPNPEQIGFSPPVQGMIWSQIYGPPRSIQPHRSKRR